ARPDAAPAAAAGRRAHLLARPQDLGRDHGAAGRAGRRQRHPGAGQHPRRGTGAPLCQPHRRHVGRPHRLRRRRPRPGYRHAQDHLRRRVVAAVKRRPFALSWQARLSAVLVFVYALYAAAQLDFSLARFQDGLGHAATLLGRMFPPRIQQPDTLWQGLAESLEIAVLASVLGIVVALPIGLLGARNLMPSWASWPARAIVALCRSLHPVIVASLFVKAVGFGALAGILALAVASVGFIGKLFTESIEEISLKQVEAVRATGASFANVILFGVL